MNFGLIGFGAWGRQHAQAIACLPGLELAAIACQSEDSARAAAAAYPAAYVTRNWRNVDVGGRVGAELAANGLGAGHCSGW